MNIHVSTSEYEFSHGKRPRGYGSWAFFFDHRQDVSDAFWAQGTYGEAVKQAKAEAKRRGLEDIIVGS